MGGPFVIIGAGPCGLAAAWHLARSGHAPIVIEREALVGGLCATHARDDFRFDLGGHRFVSADAELSRWLVDLLGDDLLTQERRSAVLFRGRQFRYPLEVANLLENFELRENARAVAGYAAARIRQRVRPSPDRTFEDWVVTRFGRPLYDAFFGPYTHKLWGIPPSRISADWAAERISQLDLGDAALRALGLRRSPARSYAKRYLYPRWGMGQLYQAMARDVTARGGKVLLGARVAGLDVSGRRVTGLRVDTASGSERIPIGQLLSTMPLPALARHLEPELPSPLARAADELRFRAVTFVNLMLAREQFSPNTWMYVASPDVSMSRIQEPKRRSASMAPPGRTSLMLEVPCTPGDATWGAPFDTLRERGTRELGVLGFRVDDVLGGFAVGVEHGYPIYHLGYEEPRGALLRFVGGFDNVVTAGRQGLFRYIFMDAAMAMGLAAASQMLEGRPDVAALDRIGRSKTVIEASALTA